MMGWNAIVKHILSAEEKNRKKCKLNVLTEWTKSEKQTYNEED